MTYFVTVLLVGEGMQSKRVEKKLDHPETFEVARATSVDDALELLGDFLFDVVIVGGPRAQIFDTIVRIRDRSAEVPILVLTRREAEPELVTKLLDLGASRCIPPTASGGDLRKAVLASCA